MLSVHMYNTRNNEMKEIQKIQTIMKGTVSPNSLKVRSFQGWLKDLIQSPEIFPALKHPILIGLAL